jgi:Fe2+ or Zn2+ uptake regulation protein
MKTRQSAQRELVLAVVRSTMEHPTAEWVYRQARRKRPGIGLATVYRNLKQLAEAGLIRETFTGGQPARFDGNTGRHYHIRCVSCGRVNDLPMSIDERLERQAAQAVNYRIVGHEVEVHGVCPACQNAETSRNRKISHPTKRTAKEAAKRS